MLSFFWLGNFINPRRFKVSIKVKITHKPKNTPLFSIPHPATKSAFERNFNAKANSKKPKITFTEFIQLPDFGNFLSELGKIANNPKGSPNASPNPSIPIDN